MNDFACEGLRRIVYGDGMTFVPVCPQCGRFVKANDTVRWREMDGVAKEPNAVCKKCGPVQMPFEGWY